MCCSTRLTRNGVALSHSRAVFGFLVSIAAMNGGSCELPEVMCRAALKVSPACAREGSPRDRYCGKSLAGS